MSKIKHTRKFQIDQLIDVVFPLFSAEGEKLWVPGWDYENIMGYSDLHENYIFLTKNHDHASAKAIWLVKRYEPESYRVHFYKVEPEDKVGIITVQCKRIEEKLTEVEVSYEYVGLSQMGNDFINGFSAAEYEKYIDMWKRLLDNYFEAKRRPDISKKEG